MGQGVPGHERYALRAGRDAATYATWKNGTKEYGVTLQGPGGDELPMDNGDVDDIVKTVKACDVAMQAQASGSASASSASSSASSQKSDSGTEILESYAIAAAKEASGDEITSAYQANVEGHGWVWVVTTKDAAANVNVYYVDSNGNPFNADYE